MTPPLVNRETLINKAVAKALDIVRDQILRDGVDWIVANEVQFDDVELTAKLGSVRLLADLVAATSETVAARVHAVRTWR